MSRNALSHVVLTDDDGSGTTGTVLNNDLFDQIQDAVDTAIGQIVQTKSGTYTALVTDDVIIGTSTWTLTLYATSGNSGRMLEVVNNGSGLITIDGNASETIDGQTTMIVRPGGRVRIRTDGSNWFSVNPLYGEGTWTPVLGGSGGTSGQSYAVQVGRYVKVGRLVTAYFYIQLSTLGTVTTSAQIQGLPFTTENVTNQRVAATIGYWTNFTNQFTQVGGYGAVNNTVIDLFGNPTGSPTGMVSLTQADLANTTIIAGSITYVATT